MVCIYCVCETQVYNSRPQKRSNTVWRRRRCIACQAQFTTVEQYDLQRSVIVHGTIGLKPFIRDKMFISIYDSLKHRKTALSDATALTDTVMAQLLSQVRGGVLERDVIASVCATVLKRFDKTAATYFVAYHPIT